MFKGLANLGNLMRNAHQLGGRMEDITSSLRSERIQATAGSGMIEIEANGLGEIIRLRIDPQLVERNDVGALETLIPAAINEVLRQAREKHADSIKSLAGDFGLGIPGIEQALAKLTDPHA